MNVIIKCIRVIIKLTLSVVLGGLLCIFLFKNDSRVRASLTRQLTPFLSHLIGGNVSFSVKHISLIPLSIELENVVSTPYQEEQGQWTWHCPSLTFGCPWYDLLLYGTVALRLEMKELEITTVLAPYGLCVWKIISRIMAGESSIPTFLHLLSVPRAIVHITEPVRGIRADLYYSLEAHKRGPVLHGDITVQHANGAIQGRKVLEAMHGKIFFDSSMRLNKTRLKIGADCSLDLAHMPLDKTCYLKGSWIYDHGLFSLKNKSGSCVCEDIKLFAQPEGLCGTVSAFFPLEFVYALAKNSHDDSPLKGVCQVQAHAGLLGGDLKMDGTVAVRNVCYQGVAYLSTATLSCSRDRGVWEGSLLAELTGVTALAGVARWNEQQGTGFVHLNNEQQVMVPGVAWSFLPKTVVVECNRSADGLLTAGLQCVAKNKKTGAEIACSAHGLLTKEKFEIKGIIDKKHCIITGSTIEFPYVQQCTCSDAQGNQLVNLRMPAKDHFMGSVSLGFIKEMLKRIVHLEFQGQGIVECVGMVQDKKLLGTLRLVNGSIRIPMTCNVVNGIQGRCVIDPQQHAIDVHDVACSLYRGQVMCPHLHIGFDERFKLSNIEVPLQLHDCLLNWKRDVFALVSGGLSLRVHNNESKLHGNITIDRAQLKQNIFSEEFQRNLCGGSAKKFGTHKQHAMNLDLHVTTKNPVRVKTAFLETSAHCDLMVRGNIAQPDLVGKISLLSGRLAFPYKPLYIAKGSIDFMPGHLNDPSIEISAKNKIKKYNVNLDVSGSLSQQDIVLEASPSLTEEQVVALLFVGSEQGSLNILAPALIMQNLKSIIFGSDQSPTGMRKSFGHFFKPLERVHLIPSFTDQTGRGGLRAAVEIDVNDRCRAMIQKNFSLTEDTKVELDYAVSDDVNLRGVRDERGDLSAEVEMRWKF
jgi:hypothetical protein